MVSAAVGPISLAEKHFALSLADSPAFRLFAAAGTQATALAKIHFDSLPIPEASAPDYTRAQIEAQRPYALTYTAEEEGFRFIRDAAGADASYSSFGAIMFELVRNVTAAEALDPAELMRLFKNEIGTICQDVLALSGQATYLYVDQISLVDGPHQTHPDWVEAHGDSVGAQLMADYGGEAG